MPAFERSRPARARVHHAAGGSPNIGVVRFMIHEPGYQTSIAALQDAMGDKEFESACGEGTGLSAEEVIAYAQRGRGGRARQQRLGITGPAELDVSHRHHHSGAVMGRPRAKRLTTSVRQQARQHHSPTPRGDNSHLSSTHPLLIVS